MTITSKLEDHRTDSNNYKKNNNYNDDAGTTTATNTSTSTATSSTSIDSNHNNNNNGSTDGLDLSSSKVMNRSHSSCYHSTSNSYTNNNNNHHHHHITHNGGGGSGDGQHHDTISSSNNSGTMPDNVRGSGVRKHRNHRRSRSKVRPVLQHCCGTIQSRASIIVVTIFICTMIIVIGMVLINVVARSNNNTNRITVQRLAVETGQFFANILDKATLPVFSLAQFATELDMFDALPRQIGQAGEIGSLPFINNTSTSTTTATSVRRNVTGVCDQPNVIEKFNKIAEASKTNAKLGDVLHSMQFAPFGVICLVSPLVYIDPNDETTILNSTTAIGFDLLNTPHQQYLARESLKNESTISIVGPRTLIQCPNCGLYVIVRIPIVSMTNTIEIDGESYDRWGFATALIQWEKLIEQSHIYDTFTAQNKDFLLTRTDRIFNSTTNTYDEVVVTLAQSKHYNVRASSSNEIVHNLQTTNNEWRIVIQYGDTNHWQGGAIAIIVVVALCISFLTYIVLMQKQYHAKIKSETLVQEAKVDIERNMTAYFAHELRNPLCAIDCALLAMPDHLSTETQELVHGMQLCSTFMSSIMNNLLDVRKMEEGKLVMRNEPFSLSKLVNNIHAMTLPTMKANVALIPIAETEGRDWVLGDIHRIEQIMYNLVSNSIKYTKVGSVTIYIGWDDNRNKKNNKVAHGDDDSEAIHLRMECRDTGPGIPKEEQENLFERFTQRGGAPGSGLGLAIAKNLVTLMKGTIYFDSDPTVRPGTTCVVVLPLQQCEAPTEQASNKELEVPIVEPISILIVDDIKMNRTMLRRRFEKCIAPNCTIQEVTTGEESIRICEGRESTDQFDVIIMDHYMHDAGGVMVGTDAIIALRRMNIGSYIIGCSGNDLDERFYSAGANLIWKKPLPSNVEIIQQLRDALATTNKLRPDQVDNDVVTISDTCSVEMTC